MGKGLGEGSSKTYINDVFHEINLQWVADVKGAVSRVPDLGS